ncbi:MAG: FG-GAP repeat domain-containing protein [Chthoniobacterales bacterium]
MKTRIAAIRNRIASLSLCLLVVAGWLAAPLNLDAAGCKLRFRQTYLGKVTFQLYSFGNVVADFNGDGNADFALLESDDQIHVYNGDGAGHFGPPATYSGGNFAYTIAVGDFNGDGRPDIVVGDDSIGLQILLNNGSGGFAAPVEIPLETSQIQQLLVADFNRDGNLDIAVSDYTNGSTLVLLGDGHGGFGAPIVTPIGGGLMAVGDFNGDGIPDLAVATTDLQILLGDGAGGFTVGSSYSFGAGNPTTVAVADFNRDGHVDLAVSTINSPPTEVATFLGDGTGSFVASTTVPFDYPEGLLAVDIDGDGNVDLVVSEYSFLAVAKGNGRGGFGPIRQYPLTVPRKTPGAGHLSTGDFNGDGVPDFVTSDYLTSGATVLITGCGGMQ